MPACRWRGVRCNEASLHVSAMDCNREEFYAIPGTGRYLRGSLQWNALRDTVREFRISVNKHSCRIINNSVR